MAYTILILGLIGLGGLLMWQSRTGSRSIIEAEKRELNELLDEARLVKSDLEDLLREMVRTSEQMVEQAEARLKGQLAVPRVLPTPVPAPKRRSERKQVGFKEIKTTAKPAGPTPKKTKKAGSDPRLISVAEGIATDSKIPDRYGPMYSLADQGLSIREIAQTLNLGQGEVELVLALKKKRSQV